MTPVAASWGEANFDGELLTLGETSEKDGVVGMGAGGTKILDGETDFFAAARVDEAVGDEVFATFALDARCSGEVPAGRLLGTVDGTATE
jgi:hypothetical protein